MAMNYRVIRAPLVLVELWNHLVRNPSLAKHVEVVEIQRQMKGFNFESLRPATVPPEFSPAAEAFARTDASTYNPFLTEYVRGVREAEKTLIAAVKNMTELKSFQWNREPPLLDSRLDDGIEDDIWTALRSCTNLRSLRVVDASDNEIEDDPRFDHGSSTRFRPIHESQIFTLSNLESFDYYTYGYNGQTTLVPVDDLIEMLSLRCPDLKTLKLSFALYNNAYQDSNADFTTVDLNSFFSYAHWPQLKTIQLYGVHLSPSVVSRFFATHPSIRSFAVVEATRESRFIKSDGFDFMDPTTPDRLSLPPNALPNITDIRAPDYVTLSILASPTPSPRPLQKLSIQLTDESFKYLQRLPSLKDISVGITTPNQLNRLAAILPDVVRLSAIPAQDAQIRGFIDALSHFHHLEVLNHSSLISEYDSPQEIESVLRKIIPVCDRLRCISMFCSSRNGVACEIEKHEGGRINWVISALDKQGTFVMD